MNSKELEEYFISLFRQQYEEVKKYTLAHVVYSAVVRTACMLDKLVQKENPDARFVYIRFVGDMGFPDKVHNYLVETIGDLINK